MTNSITQMHGTALQAQMVVGILDEKYASTVIGAAAFDGACLGRLELTGDPHVDNEVASDLGKDARCVPAPQLGGEIVRGARDLYRNLAIVDLDLAILVGIDNIAPALDVEDGLL